MNIKIKLFVFAVVVTFNSISFSQNYGGWTEIDSMNIARVRHAMVVLPNGDVLVSGNEADSIQSSCEIFEFSTGRWRYTKPMNVPRALHHLVLLNSGNVLAIGGYKERSCELFDPTTETWTMTDSIPTFRFGGQTVTKLSDGKIIVIGGYYIDTTSWNYVILNNADIYDPQTNLWTIVLPMQIGRERHTATLLNDGKLLIAGGDTENFETEECEIYDPFNNNWTECAPMLEKRYAHAAIRLESGNVFVSGGNPSAGYSCELYDVNTNQWHLASDILGYRSDHNNYYLSKLDKLMILGGDALPPSTEDTWEIYDPNTLVTLHYESFPINQFLISNDIQLSNENLMVAGGGEYEIFPFPFTWPSKRCWIFDATTDVNKDQGILKCYKLNQNYPNPFNPATVISYSLQFYSKVELEVFNILGEEVALLVNTDQPSGDYNVKFDASNLSSGIYYYRLTVNEIEKTTENTFQQTKKMVLLR